MASAFSMRALFTEVGSTRTRVIDWVKFYRHQHSKSSHACRRSGKKETTARTRPISAGSTENVSPRTPEPRSATTSSRLSRASASQSTRTFFFRKQNEPPPAETVTKTGAETETGAEAEESPNSGGWPKSQSGCVIQRRVIASALFLAAGVLATDPNNHAPEWDAATPKEQTGNDTTAIHFVVRATDADNDPLTYNLSGLPTAAKAEASEGAVQVSWTPTADDLGVYKVIATVSDGKTTATREIKLIVEEEHESYVMPGIGFTSWVPGSTSTLGVFNGFSIEFLAVRWVHQNEKRGPSHGSLYVDFDILFSSLGNVDPAFMPVLGFDLSLERNPARRFLIPYFGLEGGALFQKQTTTLGLLTPFLGLHFFATRNFEIGVKAGYMLPFTSDQFSQVAGFRGRLSADLAFW